MRKTRRLSILNHGLKINDCDRNEMNVVYRVVFNDNKVYIGSTITTLTTRISKLQDAGRENRNNQNVTKRVNSLFKNKEIARVDIIEKVTGSTRDLRDAEYFHIRDSYNKYGDLVLNTKSIKKYN